MRIDKLSLASLARIEKLRRNGGMPLITERICTSKGWLVMTNPSHQPDAADALAKSNPWMGPAKLRSAIAMLTTTPVMLQAVTMPLLFVALRRSAGLSARRQLTKYIATIACNGSVRSAEAATA